MPEIKHISPFRVERVKNYLNTTLANAVKMPVVFDEETVEIIAANTRYKGVDTIEWQDGKIVSKNGLYLRLQVVLPEEHTQT